MTSSTAFDLGPLIAGDHHYALLEHVLTEYQPEGVALEFGVGSGTSARLISERMHVIGFDSWLGLPENWRPEFPAGSFAFMPPQIDNVELVDGWFEDTVLLHLEGVRAPSLVHIDCDLYSSTATALQALRKHHLLTPGCFIVFDEFHSYEGCEDHEQRAWREHSHGLSWTVIGHGHEQWAIQIGQP